MALPSVTGSFRVAMEPELRFAPSGVAVLRMRAVTSSKKKEGDEWVDDKTCWVNLLCFKQQAEHAAESFKKGDLVVVTGRLQTEDWEDDKGGKRTSVTVVVDEIGMSTRFAPATSASTGRSSGGGGGKSSAAPADDPWAAPAQTDEPPF